MKRKVLIVLCLVIFTAVLCTELYATTLTPSWWTQANEFFNGTVSENKDLQNALSGIESFIKVIGNIIFFTVTVILGVKYIWGSVESKASIKESMVTLVVAALFFYGYSTISSIINVKEILVTADAYISAKNVYNIILYICNFLALGGIVFIGVKYMLAGASGKAELKTKAVPAVLGIVMVYCTLTFLQLIISVI